MDEDYVSFETAKLLKEKGLLVSLINIEDWLFSMYDTEGKIRYGCFSTDWYPRITLQMACKWLREVHNIYISIQPDFPSEENYKMFWCWFASTIHKNCINSKAYQCYIETYEQALESAIKYSLENLIK